MMGGESIAFWALASFCATFAFSAKRKLVCLIVFGSGVTLLALYGAGIIAEAFWTQQIQAMWSTFALFGSSNLLVNFGAGTTGTWLGGKYGEK